MVSFFIWYKSSKAGPSSEQALRTVRLIKVINIVKMNFCILSKKLLDSEKRIYKRIVVESNLINVLLRMSDKHNLTHGYYLKGNPNSLIFVKIVIIPIMITAHKIPSKKSRDKLLVFI